MKISEIAKKINEKQFVSDDIKVTPYLTIFKKEAIINGLHNTDEETGEKLDIYGIVEQCIDIDDKGFATTNPYAKSIAFNLALLMHYSDIEIDVNTIDDMGIYDYCMAKGIFKEITDKLPNEEYWLFYGMIEDVIENKIKSENSIEAIAMNTVNEVKVKLFNLMDNVNDKLDKFDIKGLKSLSKGIMNDLKKNPEIFDRVKDIFQLKQDSVI